MVNAIPRELVAFPHRLRAATRWIDNDAFGHMNNAVHYQFFDTAVNLLLRDLGEHQRADGGSRFLVAETGCRYFAEMAYPDVVTVGLRVGRIGRSSVRYEMGLFRNDDNSAAASGYLVHVNTSQNRAVPIDEDLRTSLAAFHGEGACADR